MSCPCSQPKATGAPGDCSLECKHKGFNYYKKKFFKKYKFTAQEKARRREGQNEFIGPVRVVLITQAPAEYRRNNCWAALITLAFFFIGGAVIPVILFSFSFLLEPMVNLHIMLFTAGLLMPTAFLAMNSYNGSMMILKPQHRKLDYVVLKVACFTCILGGFTASFMSSDMNFVEHVWSLQGITFHGCIGALASVLCLVDVFSFCCMWCSPDAWLWNKFALILCIPSFVMSSVCFITGLLKPSFQNSLKAPDMLYFGIAYCIIYTIIIIWNPVSNLRTQDCSN